jgi:hypothetical protein
MKEYYKIKLLDEGSFYTNEDATKLDITSTLELKYGDFIKSYTRDYNHVLSNTVHETYSLTQNDKFYFLPGVTIPRIKLKDIHNTYKIRTVRDITEATHIFIGSNTINKISDSANWEYSVNTVNFLSFINDAYANHTIEEYYYKKIIDTLEFYTNDLLLIDRYTFNLLTNDSIPYNIKDIDDRFELGSDRFLNVHSDYIETLKSIEGLDLYIEDSLMDHINGPDAVNIDETMFVTLSEMFASSDKDNRVLAMEIMANCNYKNSLLYLTLLFHDYGGYMDDINTKNHVNFKSLRTYFGLDGRSLSITPDQVVEILIIKNGVTFENMNIVLNKFGDRINSYGKSKHFIPKTVCFSEEVDKILNQEITYNLKNDYNVKKDEVLEESVEVITESENIITHTNTQSDDFFEF